MNLRFRFILLGAIVLCADLLPLERADAQNAFGRIPAHGQFRDVLLNEGTRSMYLAVYDRNEVVRVSIDTGRVIDVAPVGRGPVALALSNDGRIVAAVNKLDNSVTLINERDFTIHATVQCGQSPTAIAALPGGGFAVANAFSDNVTLVDHVAGEAIATIDSVASVPTGVAASETYLGVITRVPPALCLFKGGAQLPTSQIAVGETPKSVTIMPNGQFIVATATRLLVINPGAERIVAERAIVANDVAADGDRIVVATDGSVLWFDAALNPADTASVQSDGWAIAVSGGSIVVTSPADGFAHLSGYFGPSEVAVAPLSPQPPRITETPLPETLTTAPAPKAPMPTELTPVPTAPEEEAAVASRPPEPMGGPPSAPPRLGKTPPLVRTDEKTLSQALAAGVSMGEAGGGFVQPDWSLPLEDIEADLFRHSGSLDRWEGNVRLTVDNTLVTADSLTRDDTTGELMAEGNITLRQGEASFKAQNFFYVTPPQEETPQEPKVAPLVDATDEGQTQQLRRGVIKAENVVLIEPQRELMAEFMEYDLSNETGEFIHAHGHAGVIYFDAKSLRVLGPDEAEAEDVWVTTCENDPPHYKIRLKKALIKNGQVVLATNARLQLGRFNTPLYIPRLRTPGYRGDRSVNFDIDIGQRSDLGYFLNLGQWFQLTPHFDFALRVLPSTKEGVGYGFDFEYDFMDDPTSPLFRSKGSFRTLYTTQDRGYTEFYHRQELTPRTIVLAQWEQWYDEDFVKDFFFDTFRDRTGPRTFINVTHAPDGQVFSATASRSTNGFTEESEKLPEFAYHLLERPLGKNFYVSFDSVTGYLERSDDDIRSTRTVNVARVTYDWKVREGFNIAPFVELEGSWYSRTLDDDKEEFRLGGVAGLNMQARIQRTFTGRKGFSGFKHVFVPSITLSHRPDSSLDAEDTPIFDALDNTPGRTRIESTFDNIVFARDAETGRVWQILQVTLYQGNDLDNELGNAHDYEMVVDIRPRPKWGLLTSAELHRAGSDLIRDRRPAFERFMDEIRDTILERSDRNDLIRSRGTEFDRILSFFYYDNTQDGGNLTSRIGFTFTEAEDNVITREALYGVGYRFSDKWAVSFEHRYDLSRNELSRQKYEIRRRLHRWQTALQLRDRASGFDIGIEFSIIDFPGARIGF